MAASAAAAAATLTMLSKASASSATEPVSHQATAFSPNTAIATTTLPIASIVARFILLSVMARGLAPGG
ncbi:hypothetical protein GCM10011320_18460 [Neoroseomonas lacus]|uniref:Secreted protein n=1 Tax=Neoroseomonas lacus TaxID=287609 RepID=A0A917NMD3_9PROT|nr:hypothetical protein GCM10011320_18460 [Neoroseomonas lacus]